MSMSTHFGDLGRAHEFLIEKPEEAARRVSFSIASDFAVLFAAAAFAFVLFSGGLAVAVVAALPTPVLVMAGVACGCAALFAGFVTWSAVNAQRGLTQIIAQFVAWQETGRRIAEQRELAQLLQNAQAVHITTAPAVESAHLVVARETTVKAAPLKLIDGVPIQDLLYFIDRFPIVGWGVRDWVGKQKLPSGRPLTEFKHYDELVTPFQRLGLLRGRHERAKGKWTTTDPTEIKRAMNLL